MVPSSAHFVYICVHIKLTGSFVCDIAVFVLKREVKLQPTNSPEVSKRSSKSKSGLGYVILCLLTCPSAYCTFVYLLRTCDLLVLLCSFKDQLKIHILCKLTSHTMIFYQIAM